MVQCMSDMLETQVLNDLNGKEIALLTDESSDIANRSQMSVMARFSKADLSVATHFLGFVHLEKGTAECIMNTLKGFIQAKNIQLSNVRFIAFDGCNTMSGIRTGVQRRIRHVSPFSVYINCRNHRLALCLAHLIKRFPLLQDVGSALLALWKVFEFSPQKMTVFKHIQMVYGEDPLAITRAATTRWLSHLQAAARFVSRYVCILDTLVALYAEKREPELYGIRLAVTNRKTVATIMLLCDILKPVNMLSLYLQEENINFTSLPAHVRQSTDSLHALIDIYQSHAGSLDQTDTEFAKCQSLFDEIQDRTYLGRRMWDDREQDLTPDGYLLETGIPLVYDLIQKIGDAFCTGDPVLTAFGFLCPQNLPENVAEMTDYGNDLIQKLVDFYGSSKEDTFKGHTVNMGALIDPVQLKTELNSFKVQLFMLRRTGKTTVESIYNEFCRDNILRECFPLTYKLLYYCMIMPSSTAVVERSFSLMSNILTKKRSRLTQRNLDATVRICHQDHQFDDPELEQLVTDFHGKKSRKLSL